MATNTVNIEQRRAQTGRGLIMLGQAVTERNATVIEIQRDLLKDLGVRVTLPKELEK